MFYKIKKQRVKYIIFPLLVLIAPTLFSQENEQSLLWEISGNGLKHPSYLYGTIHIADERVFTFKEEVMNAFKSCNAFAMELEIEGVIKSDLLQKLIMDSSYTIQSLLSPEDYKLVSDFFRDSLKQNILMFNKIQPMFIASMVSQRHFESDKNEVLDLYFYSLAKEQNKSITGLETMEEQMNALKSISYQKQAEGLLDAVKNSSKNDKEIELILDDYIRGDLEKLLQISSNKEISEDFIEVFINRRNRIMADRAEAIMKEKSVFIAVGAAHLGGNNGMINLLRSKGYSIKAK